MFDGLTMVNVDGQMPDEMMVDHGLMVTLLQGQSRIMVLLCKRRSIGALLMFDLG